MAKRLLESAQAALLTGILATAVSLPVLADTAASTNEQPSASSTSVINAPESASSKSSQASSGSSDAIEAESGKQTPAKGKSASDNSNKSIEETYGKASINELNIPEDSTDIYVIKPPAPSKEDLARKPSKPQAVEATTDSKDPHAKRRTTPPMLTWDPTGQPTCVLLCIHGLGLYNHSYEDFGKRMAKAGIAVCAIDVRGFGSWAEAQGHEKVDFDGCLADIKATLKVLHRVHPNLPVFIVGESMGGAIALRATALYPDLVSGLISSVPAADRFQQKRTALKVAAHLLASPDKPFDVGTGIINQATVNPVLKQAWLSDPLDRLNVSANELLQFQAFMNQNHESAKWITDRPVLIVQGCKDHLVRPEGTVELYNELGTADRELILIPKSEHLIFEEDQCSEQVLQAVIGWINSHLPASSLKK